MERAPSLVGQRTSPAKLRGKVYTPAAVADRLLTAVRWPDCGTVLLDPGCGDGVFVLAAIEKVLRRADWSPAEQAAVIRDRIVAYDIDAAAVERCRENAAALAARAGLPAVPVIECRDTLTTPVPAGIGCVVGNPPYLEAKRMPAALKTRLRETYPLSARGAFDLYAVFVERAVQALSVQDGEVCLILPNRVLVAGSTAALREHLLARFDVTVDDLSGESVFPGTAVYPVVLHLRGRRGEAEVAPADRLPVIPVLPRSETGRRMILRILRHPQMDRLAARFDVRWAVTFHRAGLREQFVFPTAAAAAHPERLLGGAPYGGNREVQPFRVAWAGRWIDYDVERARAAANPLPALALFKQPKVVVCQNARRCRAAVDRDGYVLKDIFLAVVSRGGDAPGVLEWLCIVLNSDLQHYVYEHVFAGTRRRGGYLNYLAQYLGALPLALAPDRDRVLEAHAALAAGDDAWEAAERLVWESYGVTAREADLLRAHLFPNH